MSWIRGLFLVGAIGVSIGVAVKTMPSQESILDYQEKHGRRIIDKEIEDLISFRNRKKPGE